jgi:aminopeptidase N
LTCKDLSQAWLNESFATYFDALFKRHDKGEDEYLYALRNNAEAYFSEDKDHYRRPIVTKVFKRPTDLFDRHLYEKGSVVLRMLHALLGENLFWKGIAAYVRKNRGKVVETVDLINALEEATGRNLRQFFDQWVFGAGHPEFRVRAWWDARKKEACVRVTQMHATSNEVGFFTVDTELLFLTGKGERREKIRLDKKSHLFRFRLDSEPALVLFDPDHALLKKVDFPKPEFQWLLQIEKDQNPLGRIDAAQALGKSGSARALEALRHALVSDRFWGVRAEAAKALGAVASEEAAEVLLNSLDVVENPKVRRVIYAALKSFRSRRLYGEIEKRFRMEASYFAEAEALRALGTLNPAKAPEVLKEALKKDSWNDILRSAALEGFTATKGRQWIPLLLIHTRPGHSQKLRMAAIRCLAAFEATPEIQARLIELAQDGYLLVQIAAVRVLHHSGDERAVPILKKLMVGDRDGRLKRLAEEAVEKITKNFE